MVLFTLLYLSLNTGGEIFAPKSFLIFRITLKALTLSKFSSSAGRVNLKF